MEKKISHYRIIGKVFQIENLDNNFKEIKFLSCDEMSIKLWNNVDYDLLKDIEYPQGKLYSNLSFGKNNDFSFEKIFKIFKISNEKLIIYNSIFNNLFLLFLETGEFILDNKTLENIIQKTELNSKKLILSVNSIGNLICYFEDSVILWELDMDAIAQDSTSFFIIHDVLGKKIFKKIIETKIGNQDILDLKILTHNSFTSISSEYQVIFWDFRK